MTANIHDSPMTARAPTGETNEQNAVQRHRRNRDGWTGATVVQLPMTGHTWLRAVYPSVALIRTRQEER